MTLTPEIPNHLHPWRKRCAAVAASTLLALLFTALSGPAARANEDAELEAELDAEACSPVVAILPAFHQHRDMAQGFLNQPLADRDSSGLSRAELWQEIPTGFANLVWLVNVLPLPDGRLVAASITGAQDQSPILGVPFNPDDFKQRWFRETISGFTTYTAFAGGSIGRRLTYKPGDPTARFRLQTPGAEGQLFKVKFNGCL